MESNFIYYHCNSCKNTVTEVKWELNLDGSFSYPSCPNCNGGSFEAVYAENLVDQKALEEYYQDILNA